MNEKSDTFVMSASPVKRKPWKEKPLESVASIHWSVGRSCGQARSARLPWKPSSFSSG